MAPNFHGRKISHKTLCLEKLKFWDKIFVNQYKFRENSEYISHDISKHRMVCDGFYILHAGLELATVATYLVDLASYIIQLYRYAEDIT